MSSSPILGVPFVASQQAQPEVTLNEALLVLQALLMGAVTQQNAPPGGPADGDVYIVGTAGSGAWSGHNNAIAIRYGSAWHFIPGVDGAGTTIAMGAAQAGLRIWRVDLNAGFVWTGSAWLEEGGAMESSTVAGVGAATGPMRWKFISNESGGAVPAFNDGTDWRRCTDRAVIT